MEEVSEPVTSNRVLHNSKPLGQKLMKKLYALKKLDRDKPLLGAHVVYVVAHIEYGVVARTLKAMDIEKSLLLPAIKEELDSFQY